MRQTAPEHFNHVRRTGDMNLKIARLQLMHDLLQLLDRPFCVPAFHEDDDVGGLPIGRDQQAAPERTFQRVLKTFWSFSQTLDCTHSAYGMDSLGQPLNFFQISRRRDVARRNRQDDLRL